MEKNPAKEKLSVCDLQQAGGAADTNHMAAEIKIPITAGLTDFSRFSFYDIDFIRFILKNKQKKLYLFLEICEVNNKNQPPRHQ